MHTLLLSLLLAFAASTAPAAEVELRTKDGQVVKGELLSVSAVSVKVASAFGTLDIPRERIANPEALEAHLPKAEPLAEAPASAGGRLDEHKVLALRIKMQQPQRTSALELAKISDLVVRYGKANEFERPRIVDELKTFGPKANEVLAIKYQDESELRMRMDLIRAVALRGNVGLVPVLRDVRAQALRRLQSIREAKPGKKGLWDRTSGPAALSKGELKERAQECETILAEIEDLAAEAGGAGAALFLWEIYRPLYLQQEAKRAFERDLSNLLRTVAEPAAGGNAAQPNPHLLPMERALLIEKWISRIGTLNQELNRMTLLFLTALLPDGHPIWDAPQLEWQAWWLKARPAVLGLPPKVHEGDLPPTPDPANAGLPLERE